MPDAFNLRGVVNVDTSAAERGLQTLGEKVNGFGASVREGLSIGAGIAAFQTGLQALETGFSALKGSAVDFNQTIDGARATMGKFFTSNEALNNSISNLNDLAAKTPFAFEGLLTAQQRTIGAARSADELKQNMDGIAVASANTGRVSTENMDRISLALGQMQSKGHLAGGEMLQLTEAGVNMGEILAKHFGVSTAKIQEMVTAGKIGSQDVFAALRENAADPKNREALDKLANTWEGALSTIGDVGKTVIAQTFRPLFDLMTEGAVTVANFLQSADFKVWAEAAHIGFVAISDGIKGLLGSFAPLGQAIADAFSMATKGDFSGALAALSDGITTQLGVIWESVTSFGSQMLGAGENVIKSFAEGMLSGGFSAISGAIDAITTFIADMLIGHSPPKAGPLSELDTGGANAAMAWAGPFGQVMQKEASGAVTAVKQTIDGLRDASRDAAGQIRDITEQTQALDQVMKGLKEKIDDTKKAFAGTSDGVKEAAAASKDHYADAIDSIRTQIDTIKDSHQQAADSIQKQIDKIKDDYGAAIDSVKTKIDGIKESYDGLETSVQRQIDQVKDKYGSAIESLRTKIDSVKESYAGQEDSIQKQIDKVKDQYGSAIDSLKDKISSLTDGFAAQEDGIQRQIDAVKDQYGPAIDSLKDKIAGVQKSYADQEDALQRVIDQTTDEYATAIDSVKTKISDTNEAMQAGLDPLQKQIDFLEHANDLVRERQDAERSIANAKIQQLQLDSLGDPAQRAALVGQLATIEAQQQSADLAKSIEDTQGKLAKGGLTAVEQTALQLKLQQLGVQKQLAELVNSGAAGEAARQAELAAAQQKQLDITRAIEDANRKILEIPLEEKIAKIKKEAEAALDPLNAQLKLLESQQKSALDPLIARMKALKLEAADTLKPLQDQLDGLEAAQKAALTPLEASLAAVKRQADDTLKPLQDQLKGLEHDQKTALDPLEARLKSVKQQGDDALSGLQSKLKGLEHDQKAALDPLQDKLRGLKAEEQDALVPLQTRLKGLERDQKAALDPLQDRIKAIKLEERDALLPLENRVKSLQVEGKNADRVFQAMLSAIAQQQKDVLKPLDDQLTAYQHQKDVLTDQRQELERIKQQIGETIAIQQEADRAAKKAGGAPVAGAPAGGIDFALDDKQKAAAEAAKTAGANLAQKLGEGFQQWWADHKTAVIEGVIGAVAGGLIGGPIGALAGAAFFPQFIDSLQTKLKERGFDAQPFIDALAESAASGDYSKPAESLAYGLVRASLRLPGEIFKAVGKVIAEAIIPSNDDTGRATRTIADGFVRGILGGIRDGTGEFVRGMLNFLVPIDFVEQMLKRFRDVVIDRFTAKAVEEMKASGQSIGEDTVEGIRTGIASKYDSVAALVADGFGIVSTLKRFFGIASPSTVMHEIGVNLIDGLLGGVTAQWDAFKKFWTDLPGNIQTAFGWSGGSFTWIADLKTIGSTMLTNIWDGLNDYWTQFSKWWADLPTNIQTAFGWTGGAFTWVADLKASGTAILTGIWDGLNSYWTQFSQWWTDLPGNIQTAFGWAGGALTWVGDLKSAGTAILTGIWGGIDDYWQNNLSKWWGGFKGAIFDALGLGAAYAGGAVDWLKDAGHQVLQSFWDGLNELWGDESNPMTVKGLLKTITDWIPPFIKEALGVHSPSQVMHDIGHNTMQGLINGLRSKFPDLQTTVKEAMSHVKDWSGVGGHGLVGNQLLAAIQGLGSSIDGDEFGRVAAAVAVSEGALDNLDQPGSGGARGPFQFDPDGELQNFARALGLSLDEAGDVAGQQPLRAADWALEGYLGDAIRTGLSRGFHGADLANYASRYGQRPHGSEIDDPSDPDAFWARAGRAYRDLFPGYAAGGWAGLHGPELAWLGERGPEYVVPNTAVMGSGVGGGTQMHLTVNVTVGSSLANRREIEDAVVIGVTEAVKRQRLSPTILRSGGF